MKELSSLKKLTNSFKQFPSVGEKSAERMAFAVFNFDNYKVEELIKNIKAVKENIHECPICGLLTEDSTCDICQDTTRNKKQCIVLSNAKDVYTFEKANTYKGVYHVLGGDISSLKGITPEDLRIKELINRIEQDKIEEIIIATNPTLEGETTALYLARILSKYNINISRIAYGLPMGSNLDYADEITISKALEGRTKLN